HELFQAGDFAKQFNQQSLKLCTVQIGEIGWRRHIRKESHRVEPGQGKNWALPTFLPLLRRPLIGLNTITGRGRREARQYRDSGIYGGSPGHLFGDEVREPILAYARSSIMATSIFSFGPRTAILWRFRARPLTLKRQTARDSRKRSVAALSSAGVNGCVGSGALCGSASATSRKERILFLTHESHPTPPGKKHYLAICTAGPSGTGVCREHRVRQAGGGSLSRRGQGLAYAPGRVSRLRWHEPRGLARPGNVQSVGRSFAAWRCRVCAALPRSGRGLLGQQRIAQLLFERRLRRAAEAERPVAQYRIQSDLTSRATLLSDYGRRTPLPAAQAGLHSLDDGQLAQHSGYALLLLSDALGQVA